MKRHVVVRVLGTEVRAFIEYEVRGLSVAAASAILATDRAGCETIKVGVMELGTFTEDGGAS